MGPARIRGRDENRSANDDQDIHYSILEHVLKNQNRYKSGPLGQHKEFLFHSALYHNPALSRRHLTIHSRQSWYTIEVDVPLRRGRHAFPIQMSREGINEIASVTGRH